MSPSTDREALRACRAILAEGSKSFAAASRLLPRRLRDPVAAVYAFCRVSDDAIDRSAEPRHALEALTARLDAIYRQRPGAHPADRGLAWAVAGHDLPRAPFDALLEGYLWDVEGRRYEDLSELTAYAVRVAASVGVLMTRLMGPREPIVLARAADLGVAMQLTNIARDVGEDARAGRVYLPLSWLREERIDVESWLREPRFSPGVGVAICRLLDRADALYARSMRGVERLPIDCQPAIRAAARIYAEIGAELRRAGYDGVSSRARTSTARKVVLLAASALPSLAGGGAVAFGPPLIERPRGDEPPPLPEARALVEAASGSSHPAPT